MEEEVAAAAAAVASQRENSESNTHNVPTPGNECVAGRDVGFFGKYKSSNLKVCLLYHERTHIML